MIFNISHRPGDDRFISILSKALVDAHHLRQTAVLERASLLHQGHLMIILAVERRPVVGEGT